MRSPHHRLLVFALLLALSGAACATDTTDDAATGTGTGNGTGTSSDAEVSLSIGDVPSEVQGNVVELPVTSTGIEIVPADADTSGDTGHYHVFVDRTPAAEGETMPREEGIIHSTEDTISVYGLDVGEHTLTVVLGDGSHNRIHPEAEASVTVNVQGPSVQAQAPAQISAGEELTVELTHEGFELAPAGTEGEDVGHFHLLIDVPEAPAPGDSIPPADMVEEGRIIHSAESTVTIPDLEPGEHTILVIVGDTNHVALDPLVADRFTVNVSS